MARFFESLHPTHQSFIESQKIFFVASAPEEGRISLSPKGLNSLVCLNPQEVAFLNVTGSGNETAAHLQQNGRLTLMFCSFEQTPLILRLYGQGKAIYPDSPQWAELYPKFSPLPGARQIIHLTLNSVQTSCGTSIPFFQYQGERETLNQWAEKKGVAGLKEYQQKNNRVSIDGLDTGLK